MKEPSLVEKTIVRVIAIGIIFPLAMLGLAVLKLTRKEDWFVKRFIIPRVG